MKKSLFALAAASAMTASPAVATTFPSLTTIYVAAGVADSGDAAANTATVIFCSNVSGQNASVRILILNSAGAFARDVATTLDHGEARTYATQSLTSIGGEQSITTGAVSGGTLNIESTQSGVFCTAYLMDTEANGPSGVALHLIRVNQHPGTTE